MGATLTISGLRLRFGGLTAIDGLDLTLSPGTVTGLVGPNGSGKSSLINVLTGHYPAQGTIRLDGNAIDGLTPPDRFRHGIVRTFQAPRVFRRLTVMDNLRAARQVQRPLWQTRAARRREEAQVRDSLALFGLDHRAADLPDGLTQLQLRLLELARAHLAAPRVLLLDEPAAGATEAEAERLARALSDHLLPGRTVLLIDHRLDLVRGLSDRIAVLRTGRKLAEGPPAVLNRPDVQACLTGEATDA